MGIDNAGHHPPLRYDPPKGLVSVKDRAIYPYTYQQLRKRGSERLETAHLIEDGDVVSEANTKFSILSESRFLSARNNKNSVRVVVERVETGIPDTMNIIPLETDHREPTALPRAPR